MKPAEILLQLERASHGLPKEALHHALLQRDALEPRLLEALRDSPQQLRSRGSDWTLHTFALYLTATWRTPEALPLIVDFFAWPGQLPGELTGDFITEHLARVLASVAHGRLEPLKRLVADPDIDDYTRSAAIDAAVIMHLTGQLPEGAAGAWLAELAAGDLDDEMGTVWGELALACANLSVVASRDDIEQAFRSGLIDEQDIRLDEFLDALADPGSVEEIKSPEWAVRLVEDPVDLLSLFGWEPEEPAGPSSPPTPPQPGRNDPCPCGSGRKFKHCCLRLQVSGAQPGETVAEQLDRLRRDLTALQVTAAEQRRQGHPEAACDALRAAWDLLTPHMTRSMETFADADVLLPDGMHVQDLVFEYLEELRCAGRQNQRYGRIGVGFCDSVVDRFMASLDDDRLDEAIGCARGELLIQSGEPLRGERFLLDLIEARPHRAAGYATLASALGQDRFAWHRGRPLDVARAVGILEEALAEGVEDADAYDLEKRLRELRATLRDSAPDGPAAH